MNATTPRTLQLESRAELALKTMIHVADEDYDFIPFFCGNFKSKPAYMEHGNWDFGSSHGRLTDAIALAREMTGSEYGRDVEGMYHRNLLTFFHEDGLSYRRNSFTEETVREHMSQFEDSASMIDQRAVLLGLTSWYLSSGDDSVKKVADKHVGALHRIARKERDSWYYPSSEFTSRGWPSFDQVHTRLCVDPCAFWGRQVMPLTRYYKATGNMDAFELAENFTQNIIHRSGAFLPDGSWNGALGYRNGHFHTRMGTLDAIAVFATETQNAQMLLWVKKSLDWALDTWCTRFGWTPGDLHDQAYEHETCSLVDAICTCITLAQNGFAQYWSIAEKFIRGHLCQSQLLDTSWIEQYDKKDKDTPHFRTYYKAAERLLGAFSGYAAPNDFVYDNDKGRGHIMDVQLCCVAAGVRALYKSWQSAVTVGKNRVWINFLLNHNTKEIEVKSSLPHEGKLEIEIHEDLCELMVRIPEWVPFGAVRVLGQKGSDTIRQETGRTLSWVNSHYIKIKAPQIGERILVSFPISERETIESAVDDKYSVRWRGDDVIGISPRGSYYPLYDNVEIFDKVPLVSTNFPVAQSTLL
jgi:hypothetical protein